jgi:tetratricopeptide (TPR) repeat protein
MDEALAAATLAVHAARGEGYRPLLAEALYQVGSDQRGLGRFDEAEATLSEAAMVAEAGRHDRFAAKALIVLSGDISWNRKHEQSGEAHRLNQLAGAIVERIGGDSELESARLRNLARIFAGEGRLVEAIEADRRAVELCRKLNEKEAFLGAFLLADALKGLGHKLSLAKRHAEATDAFGEALRICEKLYGGDNPFVADVLLQRGYTLGQMGRFADALPDLERAAAIRTRVFGEDSPWTVESRSYLGNCLIKIGRLAEAETLLEHTVTDEGSPPDRLGSAILVTDALGRARAGRGSREPAIAAFEAALAHPVPEEGFLSGIHGVAQLHLAEVLWSDPRQRRRALALAREAQRRIHSAPSGELDDETAEVDSWLRDHAAPKAGG